MTLLQKELSSFQAQVGKIDFGRNNIKTKKTVFFTYTVSIAWPNVSSLKLGHFLLKKL